MQGPRLYRFFNYESMAVIPAPTAGWNPDANPWELADTQAPVLDNALIRPGRVVPRGALTNWADLSGVSSPGPPLNVCGVQPVPGTQKLAIGRKAASITAFVDPWFAPIIRPTTAAALAAPTADLVVISGGATLTSTAAAPQNIPGPRGINFEGTRYFISYGTSTSPVQDAGGTFFAQTTNLCTLSSAGTPTVLTNAPRGFIDIKGYQSRIWGLGGIDDPASGTTFSPLALFFTNPIGPGGGNAASFADWKDPVGGITNKILMDGDTTDPGVGLATVRNGLLIFRYASVWLLKGSTTANYTLVPVSRDTGCIDPRSIVETDEGVYYMSRQGLMLTNGVTVKNVSGAVTHTLQSAVGMFTAAVKSSFGGYCSCAVASGGQVVVTIGSASVTSGAPDGHIAPIWAAMFDPSANAWTRITSALFASDGNITQAGNNYPGYVFNTPDRRLLSIGDKYVTQWEAESGATQVTTFAVPNAPTAVTSDAAVGSLVWSNPTNVEVADGVFASAASTFNGGAQTGASSVSQTATGGSASWSNLSTISHGVYSSSPALPSVSMAAAQASQLLEVINFGFTIPSTANIVGIIAEIASQQLGGMGFMEETTVQLLKAGSPIGTNKATGLVASSGSNFYGAISDFWGTTWTPSDINSSGFGIQYGYTGVSGTASGQLLRVSVSVYYSDGFEILKATGYGFTIPSNATITGIQVAATVNSSGGEVVDQTVKLYKAGVLQTTNRSAGASWPTTTTTRTYGGSTDLWGTTWTPSDVNNAGFGAGIAPFNTASAHAASETANVDAVLITVFYSVTNVVKQQSFVKEPALYDEDVSGNFQPIPFLWRTKLLPTVGVTSMTRKKAQLKRWIADYVFQGIGLPSANGFTVSLKDATGALVTDTNSQVVLPLTNNSAVASSISGGPPNAATSIQRASFDCWAEVVDVCLEIAWIDVQQASAPAASIAEIYTAGIEFQHTSELR